jgi:hypothetical protein
MPADDTADRPATVFGYVDQSAVIKKIDQVDDDDLASCFFGDSLQDVENAGVNIFDIGIQDDVTATGPNAVTPFGTPNFGPSSTTPAPTVIPTPPPVDQPAPTVPVNDVDAQARQAFILGGPPAMRKD